MTGACCCWRGQAPSGIWLGRGEAGEIPWLSGAEGYEQAQQLALKEGISPAPRDRARQKCRRCKALDNRMWRARDAVRPWRAGEGAAQPGCGDGSEHSAPLPQVGDGPRHLCPATGEPLRPIRVVPISEEIWMPGVTHGRGLLQCRDLRAAFRGRAEGDPEPGEIPPSTIIRPCPEGGGGSQGNDKRVHARLLQAVLA